MAFANRLRQFEIFKLKIEQILEKKLNFVRKKFFGDILYFVHFMNIENLFHENAIEILFL